MAGRAVATGLGHHGLEVEGLLVSVRQQHFCTVPGEMRHRQGQAALPEFVPENCQLQVTGTRGCWRSFRGASGRSRARAGLRLAAHGGVRGWLGGLQQPGIDPREQRRG